MPYLGGIHLKTVLSKSTYIKTFTTSSYILSKSNLAMNANIIWKELMARVIDLVNRLLIFVLIFIEDQCSFAFLYATILIRFILEYLLAA